MSLTNETVFRGLCDASAAVGLGTNLVAVASDEVNQIQIYDRDRGGAPLQTFDLTDHLALTGQSAEMDLEGAARIGDTVYWIASHARNHDGKERSNRHRLFATRFGVKLGKVTMQFIGQPYSRLALDLAAAPELKRFDFFHAAKRAPKEPGALNIEGLSATANGELLIGFRNPVPGGRALLVPLKNPSEIIAGQAARFGEPILLNLGGLGVRDIAFHGGRYVIVAGAFDGRGEAKLFSWAGGTRRARAFKEIHLKGLNPEAVAIYPDLGRAEFQLFSDDSGRQPRGQRCENLPPESRAFRSVWVTQEMNPE